jgi:hypothetical protein
MRFVPIKSVDQQGVLTLHRLREGYKEERIKAHARQNSSGGKTSLGRITKRAMTTCTLLIQGARSAVLTPTPHSPA